MTTPMTEVELAREIIRILPVARARGDLKKTSDDTGLAFAIAKRLLLSCVVTPVAPAQMAVAPSQRQGRAP